MSARIWLAVTTIGVALALFWWLGGDPPMESGVADRELAPPPAATRPEAPPDALPFPPRPSDAPVARAEPTEPSARQDSAYWRAAHIEDFREALYELDIDSVDRLHLLDEFVAIGDVDARSLWNQDWSSADTYKREADGFRLEELDDGGLVFVPGEGIASTYTFLENMSVYDYDPETREFVHEVDYYGKPIQNIVKFLRNDVMVFMVVSGRKVDMNLYQRSTEPD